VPLSPPRPLGPSRAQQERSIHLPRGTIRLIALAITTVLVVIACTAPTPGRPDGGTTASNPPVAGDPATKPTARPSDRRQPTPTATAKPPPTPEARSRNTPTPVAQPAAGVNVTDVADGLQIPVNLQFAPDGRLFFTEVSKGVVRIMDPDRAVRPEPFTTLRISRRTEQGALGLALDPNFAVNRHVYVYYSQRENDAGDPKENRVVRFTEREGVGTDMTTVVDNLPIGICCHNGGRIGFGPDGKLYVTVGDQNRDENTQKLNRLHGKVLRVNPNGTVPEDNPFPGSPVYALGFRNPWGLAFHPRTGFAYVTDNGDVGHDEVNRLVAGGNYGTPEVEGTANDPRFVDPLWETGVGRAALTGATFYTGSSMPEYQNDLFFCAFNTGDLTRMRLAEGSDQILEQEVLAKNCYLDVANGPDGALYFASLTGIHRFGR